ncbi:MAG TPA: hypothetical protein VGV37_06100 [Aliidongia sp.]|uniref:hypothetical protein n=1 Tax=Aliidongia sp. TaxID=1914230 RepID=UPI002DDD5DA6|nr:hypothetical protein [Aliidongia sp.]HEV2674096.1 hypothetical protein [Aliidongia sp.]
MTTLDIPALLALCEKATPGCWDIVKTFRTEFPTALRELDAALTRAEAAEAALEKVTAQRDAYRTRIFELDAEVNNSKADKIYLRGLVAVARIRIEALEREVQRLRKENA